MAVQAQDPEGVRLDTLALQGVRGPTKVLHNGAVRCRIAGELEVEAVWLQSRKLGDAGCMGRRPRHQCAASVVLEVGIQGCLGGEDLPAHPVQVEVPGDEGGLCPCTMPQKLRACLLEQSRLLVMNQSQMIGVSRHEIGALDPRSF